MRIKRSLYLFFVFTLISLSYLSCGPTESSMINEAEKQFINEVQYMSEKEALANEISYYRSPEISIRRKVRNLTGKDVFHECNILLKENEINLEDLRSGRASIVRTWNVGHVKSKAVDKPDAILGEEYFFSGKFTHYNNGYEERKARVLHMCGEWYVIQQYN